MVVYSNQKVKSLSKQILLPARDLWLYPTTIALFFHFSKSQMSEKWGWYFPSSFPSSPTLFHIVSVKIIALRAKQGKGKQIPPKPQLWTKMDHKHISPSASLYWTIRARLPPQENDKLYFFCQKKTKSICKMPTNGIYPGENQAGLQTELDRRGWRLEELPNPFSKQISTFKWSFKVPQRTRNKVCFSLNKTILSSFTWTRSLPAGVEGRSGPLTWGSIGPGYGGGGSCM